MTEAVESMALAGLKVLDLSRILAGPSATQLLGDLGADVVKVEKPHEGDDTRRWGPPYIRDYENRQTSESAYYLCANRNKRSIAVNLASPEGRELIHRLLERADVLVENYKVGGLAHYGLSYDQIKVRYPKLIYCSITGFGQTGPYSSRSGYDFLIQGMGGIMSLTGEPDGQPMKVGVGISDIMTGMYAAVGILAAIQHRNRHGVGQHIDISLLDSQIAWLANGATNYLADGRLPQRFGNGHPNIVPYQVFNTSDDPVIIAVGNDAQFGKFCRIVGLRHLSIDQRYSTNSGRVERRIELCELIGEKLKQQSRSYWISLLESEGVPCGPVNNLHDVFSDPHVQSRGAEIRIPCDWALDGYVRLLANPLKLSRTPPTYRSPPPRLDEHRESILNDWLSN